MSSPTGAPRRWRGTPRGPIRHDLFAKIERLSSKQMDELTVPSLISRLTSDTYNVNQTLGRIQRLGVRAPILLLGGMVVTLLQDWRLSMVLLSTLPLLAAGVALISWRGIPLYAPRAARRGPHGAHRARRRHRHPRHPRTVQRRLRARALRRGQPDALR